MKKKKPEGKTFAKSNDKKSISKEGTPNEVLEGFFQSALKNLEEELYGLDNDTKRLLKKSNGTKKGKSTRSHLTEIHLSGRVDNFLFGSLKEIYFEEYKNAHKILKGLRNESNPELLELLFSLFLENNQFSNKSNLDIFNENIDLEKFKEICPKFYQIYETVLPSSYEKKEVVIQDEEMYLKSSGIRSTTYDCYSFLKEIMDSPNFSNPLRVFSSDNFIEIYVEDKKTHEGQLDEFLELKEVHGDENLFDENDEFIFSEKQTKSIEVFTTNKTCYPQFIIQPFAKSKQGSIQFDGFWPIDYFKFVLGESPEVFDQPLYLVLEKNYQYERSQEVKVVFSNVSKYVFKIPEKIDFEKLMLLRCGLDSYCREEVINYGDDINLFNFIAYGGVLISPEETIYRDKGIFINLTQKDNDENGRQPTFCTLFID